MVKKVMLDAGHGGSDPGAQAKGYKEKDFNLTITLNVRDYLVKNYEVNVLLTRTTDKTLSLSARTDLANRENVDYFCSIHVNASGGTGFESFIYNGPVSANTVTYQSIIHDEIMNVIGTTYNVKDRGKKRANFHVLRETKMEAILVETLFIDNDNDLKLLTSPSFIRDYSVALANGIAKALQLPKKEKPTKPTPEPNGLYKVIAGSFKERKNAEERVRMLNDKKIDSFIVPTAIDGSTFYRVQTGAYRERKNAEAQLENVKAAGVEDAFILPPEALSKNEMIEDDKMKDIAPIHSGYPIQGESLLSGELLDQFVEAVNPQAPKLGALYIQLARTYHVRGDIAFAQAIHETDYFRFTGDVSKEQNNYAGIGATGGGAKGATFQTKEEGVLAHLQHLFAYASKNPLPTDYPLVDPRFDLVTRGSATTWQSLNGKWAVPGDQYGQLILKLYLQMLEFSKEQMTIVERNVRKSI